jgi:hypothetical protein
LRFQPLSNSGNSFVCAVEFGDKVKAVFIGWGNSSDPKSKHFNDQSEMSKGQFKDVLFLQRRCRKQSERKYHPGE